MLRPEARKIDMSDLPPQEEAASFDRVLWEEINEIREARMVRGVKQRILCEGDPKTQARRGELFGLALSGGGIRSATFNLGVLQGLAKYQLLPQIDYLSTVSGGGYIGAWFIALLNKQNSTENQVEAVQKMLSPAQLHHPEAEDQEPIAFLRQYSNYLTPRFIFYSADLWTMFATWSRNFLLNFLLLVSAIGAVLLVPRLLGLLFVFKWQLFEPSVGLSYFLPPLSSFDALDASASVFFFSVTTVMLCIGLSPPNEKWRASQWRVQWTIVWPLFLGVLFLARWLRFSPEFFHGKQFWPCIWLPCLFFAVVFSLIAGFSGLFRCFWRNMKRCSRA